MIDHLSRTVSDLAGAARFYDVAVCDSRHSKVMRTEVSIGYGVPGLRAAYHAHYYGAFVLDPDGNRLEAVCLRPA